ncbi:WD40 repeat domain-containing serine/threonine protein kinase [Aerolutibacter daejeonensis]|uniref:WD40 repeat domain-containing serine/threonine protein kinase n=1 Tax=Aerolutibacter daejeonensis TaxID=346181 RepID=UPI00068A017C|nr:WD40 repeat domain-containing serine/threonine-protein kinase [Lysobacter daejeonensis]
MPNERDQPGTRDTRWWMNSAVVRLAFGQETLADGAVAGDGTRASELDPDDPAQREFGDYELRAVLGRGGMGVVYRAFQRSLDREVALKLLSGGVWAAPEFVATLRSEARHAALLQHPNIVTVHEIGDYDGQIYYAMQLVEGRTLAERLQQEGPLAPREAAVLLRTVAEAVDYAHRQGMLHLDLKPGNLILGNDQVPRITDFGLARRLGADGLVDNERVSGTPGYMAPEQVQVHGERLSPATDVWGLGAILYEALTGHQPFEGDSPQAVVALVLAGTVRGPRRYNEALPHDLEAICLRCLEKDPARRYRSARALADDLGRFIEEREVRARPLNAAQHAWQWMRREPRLAAVSGMALIALLVGVLVAAREWRRAEAHSLDASRNLWAQREESAWRLSEDSRGYAALASLAANLREQEAAGAASEAQRERLRLGLARARMPTLAGIIDAGAPIHVAALSPDGSLVALGLDPLTVALYERVSGKQRWRVQLRQHRNPWDGQLRRLVFTPDGRHLIVSEHWTMAQMRPSGYQTFRLALADGAQTRVAGGDALIGESWSDDGRHVLAQAKDGGVVLYTAEGAPRARSRVAVPGHPDRPGWLLPAGLPFVGYRLQPERVDILDADTLALRHRIDIDRAGDSFIAWSATPDGRWLLLGTREGRVLQVDPATGAKRLLLADAGGEITWLSTSAQGKRLAVSMRSGDLSLWSLPEGTPISRVVLRRELWGHQLECDAKGDHCLLLAMHWDRVAMWSIDSVQGQGGQTVRIAPEITHHSVVPRFASSFDGKTGVVATGSQDGFLRLWQLPSSAEQSARAAPQREWPLRFDGRRLVDVDGLRLRLVDARDGRPASKWMSFKRPIGFAALVADGQTLVATAGRELHVLDTVRLSPRYPPIPLDGAPMDLLASDDGRVLLTRWLPADARSPGDSRVQAFDLALGHPLGPAGDMPFVSARLSQDGQRLLVTNAEATRVFGIRDLRQPRFVLRAVADDAMVVAAELDEVRQEVVQAVEDRNGNLRGELQRWSLDDGRLIGSTPLNASIDSLQLELGSGTVAISGRPGGTATSDLSVLVRHDGTRLPVTLANEGRLARAQALSADGTILAQALFNGVMLVDATNGAALGPPLQAPLPGNDIIAQVAFAPDRRSLLARTALGRWLAWTLAPDMRPTRVIEEETAILAPPPSTRYLPPSDALRASWLGGARQPRSARGREPSAWSCLSSAWPPRLSDTPARALDLSRHYTDSLHDTLDLASSFIIHNKALGNLCGVPMGLQRLRGVDYDIRGLVRLPAESARPIQLQVPLGRYAAAHVLSAIGVPPYDFNLAAPVAQLEFHYVDGSRALQPWHTQLDVDGDHRPTYWPQVAPAWQGLTPRDEVGPWMGSTIYTTRVANPYPQRLVAGLSLHAASPAIYDHRVLVAAVTLAPAMAP